MTGEELRQLIKGASMSQTYYCFLLTASMMGVYSTSEGRRIGCIQSSFLQRLWKS